MTGGRALVALLAVTALPVALADRPAQAQPNAPSASSARVRTVAGVAARVIHPQGPCRGGAAITRDEIAAKEAKIRRIVLSSTKFTAYAGSTRTGKPVAKFATDRAGTFAVRLPVGQYCVALGDLAEVKAKAGDPVAPAPATTASYLDAACMEQSALACDATLFVQATNANKVKLELHTFTRCPQAWAHPCWRGPMPP